MQFIAILNAIGVFFTRIIVISCLRSDDHYVISNWRTFTPTKSSAPSTISTSSFKFSPKSFSSLPGFTSQDDDHHPKTSNTKLASQSKPAKYESLSPQDFSYDISDLLSPDIFSQENPIQFFIDKMNTMNINQQWMIADLKSFLVRNKFPPHYVPYAKVLCSLLNIESDLSKLRWSIHKIQIYSPLGYSTLPPEFSTSTELSAVFSGYVFSDPIPPSRVLNEVLKIPKNRIVYFIIQLTNLSDCDDSLPPPYISYVKNLRSLFQNEYYLESLKSDISEMQQFAARERSSNNITADT